MDSLPLLLFIQSVMFPMSLVRVPSKQDAREAVSYESYAAAATGLRREIFRFYSESVKDSRGG